MLNELLMSVVPNFERTRSTFRYWQVESLLTSASILLDRAQADRREFLEIEIRQLEASLNRKVTEAERDLEKSRNDRNHYHTNLQILNQTKPYVVDLLSNRLLAKGSSQAVEGSGKGLSFDNAKAALAEANARLIELDIRQKSEDVEAKLLAALGKSRLQRAVDLLKAMDNPQGPYGFGSQLGAIANRIKADVQEAYDRASAAAIGLELLFGNLLHVGVLLPLPNASSADSKSLGADTLLVDWVRAAIRMISANAQREQVFTFALSLRQECAHSWQAASDELKASGHTRLSFEFGSDRLPDQAYVRLRGLTASTVSDKQIWSLVVQLPRLASVRILDSTGAAQIRKIDQSALPACRLGRVESRSSPRQPETCGTNSLINATPFSESTENLESYWHVDIEAVGVGEYILPPDIILEIALAGLPS